MLEIFNYTFMVRAFIAGVTIALVAPLIGNFLIVRRLSLIADTLSHVALAGVAIGLLINLQPLVATVFVTVLAAIMIEQLRTKQILPAEAILAIFLPGGLAVSLILINLANGFNVNLFSYLFGSLTTVRPEEVGLILLMGIVVVLSVGLLYRELLYVAFDEESAQVAGIKVRLINLILIILTAVTVALSMRIVGILLVGALLVIPGVTAMQWGRGFKQSLFLSLVIALISVVAGLFAAYYLNLPAGAAIVLVSLALFVITLAARKSY